MDDRRAERHLKERGDTIMAAARVLIGAVRRLERDEGRRSAKTELSIEVQLTAGGVETWVITIERTASSH